MQNNRDSNWRFSVLIPIYFKENPEFFHRALASILTDQSLRPDQVVIVEDGPIKGEIDKVITYYEELYGSVIKRYKLEQNQGMGKAMNFGLQNISTPWIARMDSDDIARPNRFERQFGFLFDNPDIDVLGSAIAEFDFAPGDLDSNRILPNEHIEITKFLRRRNPINHMTAVFRKDLAIQAGGYWDERYFEDYNLWYEMYKAGALFYNLSEVLMDVRVGNNMIQRRSGYNYFQCERLLLGKFVRDGFISKMEYSILVVIKFLLRILPTFFLRYFYKLFLRQKSK